MDPWYVPLDGTRLPTKEEIGGKAWSLARMRQLGLPVPPAFVLPTHVCHRYADAGRTLPPQVEEALRAGIAHLEEQADRRFGAGTRPLLVSVRSGAPVSMPGMMDTILDLGIDDAVERALVEESGDPRYAADTHTRFVTCYGRIVLKAYLDDAAATPAELRSQVERETGRPVPADPWEQLRGAVAAVFDSWQSRRAKAYRRHWGIPDTLGTAVTVQAMVFGNLDDRSGTGVLFTRDPLTGGPHPYGEYLPRGQGEDVVAGERTPLPLAHLAEQMPDVHAELLRAGRLLESEGGDVQDVEFTVERGRLYLLQSRRAKRSPQAAVRLAVDLVDDGVIGEADALTRVTPDQIRSVLRARLDDEDRRAAEVLATGEPACPGTAAGLAVTDADEAVERAERGESVVFVATTTSPEDIHAMIAAVAVCTGTGGSTSHAAVVCRGLGRPAVVGCGNQIVTSLPGRAVTVDGESGRVFAGALPLRVVSVDDDDRLLRLSRWAAAHAPIRAVVPDDAPAQVIDLDALGIVDADDIARAVSSAQAAAGSVLDTDAGIAAAVDCGLHIVVTDHPLPALLAAYAAVGTTTAAYMSPEADPVVAGAEAG
jgi:pyruvate,orthophosphate dikinase